MSVPPTGTATFLVADIEGPISLWESNPETMQAALTRYDEILGGFAGVAGMRSEDLDMLHRSLRTTKRACSSRRASELATGSWRRIAATGTLNSF